MMLLVLLFGSALGGIHPKLARNLMDPKDREIIKERLGNSHERICKNGFTSDNLEHLFKGRYDWLDVEDSDEMEYLREAIDMRTGLVAMSICRDIMNERENADSKDEIESDAAVVMAKHMDIFKIRKTFQAIEADQGKEAALEWLNNSDEAVENGRTAAHFAVIYSDLLVWEELQALAGDAFNMTAKDKYGLSVTDLVSDHQRALWGVVFTPEAQQALDDHIPTKEEPVGTVENPEPQGWNASNTLDYPILRKEPDASVVDTLPLGTTWEVAQEYVYKAKPFKLASIWPACGQYLKDWSKESFVDSELSKTVLSPGRIPYGNLYNLPMGKPAPFRDYIANNMGKLEVEYGGLHKEPEYIFNKLGKNMGPGSKWSEYWKEFLDCGITQFPWMANVISGNDTTVNRESQIGWTFGLGGAGSGTPQHIHSNAINYLMGGRKRWFVEPPASSDITNAPVFATVLDGRAARTISFLQLPGEMVYIPGLWGHSTLGLGDVVGWSMVLKVDFSGVLMNPARKGKGKGGKGKGGKGKGGGPPSGKGGSGKGPKGGKGPKDGKGQKGPKGAKGKGPKGPKPSSPGAKKQGGRGEL